MNDLYLIGNGFDLAHGLKTSYNDFLLWYLKHSVSRYSPSKSFEDDLIIVKRPYNNPLQDHSKLPEFFAECKQLQISLDCKYDFFEQIVRSSRESKWVDIEYEYFMYIILLFKRFDYDIEEYDSCFQRLLELNMCFDLIKKKLMEYLKRIEISSKHENRQIEGILLEGTGADGKERGEKLFVNFNYTKTLEFYTNRNFPTKNSHINIHGELGNPSNPIIFGYGDEMDSHYEKIENLNNNEFLRNIKSFGYFKTTSYQDTIRFVESGNFTVKILGHSCGLSDRILLNAIFEHPNCKAIKIYYYQKSESENDYFEKTQEISRHFKASKKGEMRMKIVPFEKSIPMPQNPK